MQEKIKTKKAMKLILNSSFEVNLNMEILKGFKILIDLTKDSIKNLSFKNILKVFVDE